MSSTPAASASNVSSSSSSTASISPLHTLPPPSPASMPSAMYYTSLQWLSSSSAAPLLPHDTPPTSPAKFLGSLPSSSLLPPETPDQRRSRQAAFLAEKNREVEEIKRRAKAGDATPISSPMKPEKEDVTDADDATNESGMVTPIKKKTGPSGSDPSSISQPSFTAATPDASQFVSPDKRRQKKLSSLHYPFFSCAWLERPANAKKKNKKSKDSSQSLGLVLLGGGGGKKGAGIDSGMLVCSVLPSNSPLILNSDASSPIRMSLVSSPKLALHPMSFLDSNDFLIGSIVPHPRDAIVAATVGSGTALLESSVNGTNSDDISFHYRRAVQTDWHKLLSAQAQAWSPGGRWIATGGEDRTIRIWSYPDLDLLAVCGGNTLGLNEKDEQHRQSILSLHVNHDGTRLISCAGDAFIKVWNTARLEGLEDEADEEEPYERKESDTIATCRLVANLTLPAVKGTSLTIQCARYYGRRRVKPVLKKIDASSPSAAPASTSEASEEEEEEEKSEEELDEPFPTFISEDDSFGHQQEEVIIAISSQSSRGGGGSSSFLKYSTRITPSSSYPLIKRVNMGSAKLTTMEISDDVVSTGYVAIANSDGAVMIYDPDQMKCLKTVKKCHGLPSTALAFSPARLSSSPTSSPLALRWLLSVSVDKSVAIIEVPRKTSGVGTTKFLIIIFALLALSLAILLGRYNPEEDNNKTA